MTPVPPQLAPVALMLGRWESSSCAEHWAPVDDVLIGVAFMGEMFELMKIDVAGDNVRYVVMPGGGTEVAFPLVSASPETVVFENPEHDAPKVIEYHLRGKKLKTRIGSAERMEWICALRTAEPVDAPDVLAAEVTSSAGRAAVMSGTSPDGSLGFTIGTFTHPVAGMPAAPYATVWRPAESGAWSIEADLIVLVD